MNKRRFLILQSLHDLGGKAGARQIAHKAHLHINAVARNLGILRQQYVARYEGEEGMYWQLVCSINDVSMATTF